MKKLFLAIVAVFVLSMTANAQNNLGIRFGGGQGYNAELSWQHGLGGNRLEFDLGYHAGDNLTAFDLTGIYQWTGDFADLGFGTFGWFAGFGAHLGYWNYDVTNDSDIALALAGQAGLELKFNIPIQLTLDIRPRVYFLPEVDFHWGDIALGVRYCF